MNQIALGKRIRTERQNLGMTQEQLAEKINVSTTYIGFIERGKRTLTLDKLAKIANELHTSVDCLLQDSVPLDDSMRTSRMQQLWAAATPQQQKLILSLTQTVLDFTIKS